MHPDTFKDIKVGVVGDIVADVYIYGRQYKLSREAPTVVAEYEAEDTFLGGAGNVINNLDSLGAKVYPVSVLGKDVSGRALESWLDHFEIPTDNVIITNERETTTKTRYLVGDSHTTKRQVVRFDKLPKKPLPEVIQKRLIENVKLLDKVVDIWIMSDYSCGILTPLTIPSMLYWMDKTIIADSRHNLKSFVGATFITPNESEVEEARITDTTNLTTNVRDLMEQTKVLGMLVTQGSKGMSLYSKDGSFTKIPACNNDEIVDVTGAGDTVTSLFALGITTGRTPLESAKLANYGASIVVMKSGPAAMPKEELKYYI